MKNKKCKCKHCGHIENLTLLQRISSPHLFDIWFLRRCKNCNKLTWLKRVKGESNNEK